MIRQLLRNIQERGETAVVYDPELDFTPEFFNSARGDVVCNPVDARMPYWSLSDEVRFPPAAAALANSLFPDTRNGENGPRRRGRSSKTRSNTSGRRPKSWPLGCATPMR